MRSKLIGILFLLTTTSFSNAQILTFDFVGLAGSEATANSNANDPNISASVISRGAGLTASANGGRFNATNWSTGGSIASAVSGNDYMEFTITPNVGCNFSISSIQLQLQRSATGPSAIALRSSLDGFAANLDLEYPIIDNTTTQSFTFTFAHTGITSATTYRFYMYAEATGGSGGIGDGAGNDIIVNGSSSCGAITITSVSSLTYNVDCITGAAGNVDFSSTGTFTAGNTYTVQLSDASGSFAAPIVIGSLVSTSNGPLDVNFTIPPATPTGTGYITRIVSSNPSVTSAPNGSNISITLTATCTPPHMTSVIINSCNAICSEGLNEMVFGTTGDYSIDVTAANFNFSYTNTPPLNSTDNFTDILTNNSTTTGVLNDQCASTDPFIDANGTTIPPNSSWVLLNNDICVADALDWAGLCNSGLIYVIYSSDPTWLSAGNFSNTTSGIRPYQTSITTTNGQTFTIDYETDGSQYADSDGVFASFDEDGGPAIAYGDDNCMLQPIVLPIELHSFEGEIKNQASLLNWTTITEYNFSHFNIYHATDVTSFYKIGSVTAAGNTELKQDYRMIHPNPVPGVNYYRLSAIDNNGSERNHGILALRMNIHFAYYNGSAIVLESPYAIEICNLQGQLITQSNDELEIPFNQSGVFLIREIESGTIQKIVIQ